MKPIHGTRSAILLTWTLLTLATDLAGQSDPVIDCPSDRLTDSLIAHDPRWARSFFYMEQMIQAANALPGEERSDALYTLPVVVHVIHLGEPEGTGTNISTAQIQSAINALNQDFRRMPGTNGFGNGVDVGVEFCLAQRDPNGNPTTGIMRVNGSSVTSYASAGISAGQGTGADETAVKSLSVWPRASYVNIWVVNEIENNDGGAGVQGYAYFPFNSVKDGIVVLHNAFGTTGNLKSYTNMNRTITHEMGHFLGLYHTFNDTNSCSAETSCSTQGDRVCDTPPTILNSSCSAPACSGNQQVENYLDYTSQSCMDMFSQGQKTRMRTTLETQRAGLLSSLGCDAVFALDAAITAINSPSGASCSNTYTPVVTLANLGSNALTAATIQYNVDGEGLSTFNWTGNLASGTSTQVTLPLITVAMGAHTFYAWSSNPNGQTDQNSSNNQFISNFEVASGGQVSLVVTLDFFGSETTWAITDTGGVQMVSGGPYPNNQPNTQQTHNLCLPAGCYTLSVFDSFGDGQGLINGSFTLYDDDNTVLAAASGNWGSQSTHSFCVTASTPAGNPPVASFTAGDATVCIGQTVSFTSTTANTPTSFTWNFTGASPPTSTQANPTGIVWNTPGPKTVTLTATNSFGSHTYTCSNCVTVISGPAVTLASTPPACAGTSSGQVSSSVSGGNAPYTFSWSTGATGSTISNLGAGSYTVTATDANGCAAQQTCTLTDPAPLHTVVFSSDISCAGWEDGAAILSVTGGTGNITILWSTGEEGNMATGLQSGAYTVSATDDVGCIASQSFIITEPSPIEVTTELVSEETCTGSDGSAVVNGMGGTGALSYLWSNGTEGQLALGLDAGAYFISITDSYGCSAQATIAIPYACMQEVPDTQLSASSCGAIGLDSDASIACYPVDGATGYQWHFEAISGQSAVEVETAESVLPLNMVSGLEYGQTYAVRARARIEDTWGAYGQECGITMNPGTDEIAGVASSSHPAGTILFYPNPFEGEWLRADLSGLGRGRVVQDILITDALGQWVETIAVHWTEGQDGEHILKLSNRLAPGIYFLTYTAGGSTTQQKLIVQ